MAARPAIRNEIVAVFGGSGFIGRQAVQGLADDGWRVRVAVRHPDDALFLKPLGEVGQIDAVACDITAADTVRAAVAGAHGAVNCVGILYERGRQRFQAVHAAGAGAIATAAAAAGLARLVHVSAIGADPGSPAHYARTKGEGEAAVRQAFPGAAILRPSVVFGPDDDFFNRFAALARVAPALPLIGGGLTRFQPVYVGDVAAAIVKCLQDDATAGRTFELGGPQVLNFRELMALVLQETGRRCLLVPLPFPLAMAQAAVLEWLPVPPLTRDQVRLLKRDNVAAPDMPGLRDLGIAATPIHGVVETYLFRYRRAGIKSAGS